jgi:heat shock protein HslJ
MRRSVGFAALLLAALSVLALAGCGAPASDAKLLEAREWKVVKIGANPSSSGIAEQTSKFAAGTVTGSAGVNRYSGTYVAKSGSSISVKVGATTLMAGTPQAMAAEQDFLKALGDAASYAVDDSSLTFFDASGVSVLTYEVLKPTPLVGTPWKMAMYNNGRGGFQSALSSATVTAVFAADGTVSGNGGVNQYHGTYKISGASIKIDPLISTQMAGPEDAMAQESAYLAALQKSTTFAMEGTVMTLRDASGAAMVGYQQ